MIRLRSSPFLQPLPALAAAAVVALAAWAGAWQSGRAHERDAVEARRAAQHDAVEIVVPGDAIAPEVVEGRRVVAYGEFLPGSTVYWDNRFAGRVAGMAMVTPLRLAGSRKVVLVDRGILVPGADRTRLPVVPTPVGPVEVHGRAYLAPKRTLELAENADAGALWQNLTPEKFAARAGMDTHGFILHQIDGASEGLLRAPDLPASAETGMTAAKHRGYAFQWYALAVLVAALFVFFTFFRHDQPPRNP